jgi:hypothetical protein
MNNQKLFFCIFLFCFGILTANYAETAILYFNPSSGNYTVGNIFTVDILVNTENVAINNAEVVVNFPNNFLEIISFSRAGSVFSLWVEEPNFSNSGGVLSFNGGLLTPGFNGVAGKVLSVVFRVKKTGSASLFFSSAAVRANDGYGTDVFKGGVQAIFNLIEELPTVTGKVPEAPQISSSTHPNENKWYSNNSPVFVWNLPPGVTGASLLFDSKATTDPGLWSDGLMESKKYENIKDGAWYFHIKFRNQYGWGPIIHRKVLIDTVPPLPFEIKVQREDFTDPRPVLNFQTTDELSGLEYYEMKIGEGDNFAVSIEEIKHNPYVMPLQAWGKHPVEVRAYDKAGNHVLAVAEIDVLPIEGVEIIRIPKSIGIGEILEIKGKAESEITAIIYIQKLDKELISEKIKTDLAGNFVLRFDKALAKGDYVVWAQAEDERGALSHPTRKYPLEVGLPPFLKFGKITLDYRTTMVILIILIIVVIVIVFYAWNRISSWRKRARKETHEAKESIEKAFKVLREEVEEQVGLLDGKPSLTQDERRLKDKLRKALDISEEFINKEIKDIEKEFE